MPANEVQIGGQHYKTVYEHWDWVLKMGMGYFDGQASKYIMRWPKKNGIQDVEKGLHFLDKLVENVSMVRPPKPLFDPAAEIVAFGQANGLGPLEHVICFKLATWKTVDDLDTIRKLVIDLHLEAGRPARKVPATDSNKHAEHGTRTREQFRPEGR